MNVASCDGCEGCQRLRYLALDGIANTHVAIEDKPGAPLKLLSTPLTVEGWFMLDPGDDRIDIARRGPANGGWRLGLFPNQVMASVYGQFDQVSAGNFADGKWRHLAWTYDQTSSRIYVNGTLLSSEANTLPVENASDPVMIGVTRISTGEIVDYTAGNLDEVRVSSTIRYTTNFTPVRRHAPDASTVGLWHFDEGQGSGVLDASSNASGSTLFGTVAWGVDDGFGGLFCD
jgi:hypothetical protein